jgi:hypothetical protein
MSAQFHAPAALAAGEEPPGTQWIRGWVDRRVGLDNVERRKILPLPGLEFRPVGRSALSQCYIDCAVPVQISVLSGQGAGPFVVYFLPHSSSGRLVYSRCSHFGAQGIRETLRFTSVS